MDRVQKCVKISIDIIAPHGLMYVKKCNIVDFINDFFS